MTNGETEKGATLAGGPMYIGFAREEHRAAVKAALKGEGVRKVGLLRLDPMPDVCGECVLIWNFRDDFFCTASPNSRGGRRELTRDNVDHGGRRPDWCPLIEGMVRDAWSDDEEVATV